MDWRAFYSSTLVFTSCLCRASEWGEGKRLVSWMWTSLQIPGNIWNLPNNPVHFPFEDSLMVCQPVLVHIYNMQVLSQNMSLAVYKKPYHLCGGRERTVFQMWIIEASSNIDVVLVYLCGWDLIIRVFTNHSTWFRVDRGLLLTIVGVPTIFKTPRSSLGAPRIL